MDVVFRAFEPEVLTRMEVFTLEGSSRELGDLGELAFNRVRCTLFDVRLDELEVAENISVVRGRKRGQCKKETTTRKYLQARSSMCVGQGNGSIVWRSKFGMCGGFTRSWRDRKGEDLDPGNVFSDQVDEFAAFRELNRHHRSFVCQKLD